MEEFIINFLLNRSRRFRPPVDIAIDSGRVNSPGEDIAHDVINSPLVTDTLQSILNTFGNGQQFTFGVGGDPDEVSTDTEFYYPYANTVRVNATLPQAVMSDMLPGETSRTPERGRDLIRYATLRGAGHALMGGIGGEPVVDAIAAAISAISSTARQPDVTKRDVQDIALSNYVGALLTRGTPEAAIHANDTSNDDLVRKIAAILLENTPIFLNHPANKRK